MTRRTSKPNVYRLDPLAERCLVILHALFALTWLVAVLLLHGTLLASSPTAADGRYASQLLLHVDELFLVPAMAGVLVTSFLISAMTERGFNKSRRIKLSWLLTLGLVALNVAFLGPWIIRMLGRVEGQALTTLADPTYRIYRLLLISVNSVQLLVLLLQAVVVMPWVIGRHRHLAAWRLTLLQVGEECVSSIKRTGRPLASDVPHL
jgi:hypothetical protein